jgi:hypothetical protein
MAFTTEKSAMEYDELAVVSETFTPASAEVVRTLQISSYSNVTAFTQEMLGYEMYVGGRIARVLPEFHPVYVWMPCVECQLFEGVGSPREGASGVVTFTDPAGSTAGPARFRVVYRTVPWIYQEDTAIYTDDDTGAGELGRYVERRISFNVEAVPLKGSSFKFTADNEPVPSPPAKVVPLAELTYVWHNVPRPPDDRIVEAIGKVNDGVFDGNQFGGGGNYPAETVLFTGANRVEGKNPKGFLNFTVTYKFSLRTSEASGGNTEATWNRFYRRNGASGPGFYDVISNDAFAVKPYDTTNLNLLFRLP